MLDLFSGQLSVEDIKGLSFGELEVLKRAREKRIIRQNNSKENRALTKSIRNFKNK